MIAEAASAIEGVRAAAAILGGMKSLNDRTKVNEAVIEVQGHLLEVQSSMLALQDHVEELRARIRELEAVDENKFRLAEPEVEGRKWSGRLAYQNKETGIFYCPGCFGEGRLTPLQFDGRMIRPCKPCGTYLGGSDDSPPRGSRVYDPMTR